MKTYYKVVYRNIENNTKVSAAYTTDKTATVTYFKDVWAYPKVHPINYRCLFIFKTLKHAMEFLAGFPGTAVFYEVWECEAGHVFGPPRHCKWPTGTLCTTKVKLIKKVK